MLSFLFQRLHVGSPFSLAGVVALEVFVGLPDSAALSTLIVPRAAAQCGRQCCGRESQRSPLPVRPIPHSWRRQPAPRTKARRASGRFQQPFTAMVRVRHNLEDYALAAGHFNLAVNLECRNAGRVYHRRSGLAIDPRWPAPAEEGSKARDERPLLTFAALTSVKGDLRLQFMLSDCPIRQPVRGTCDLK